MSEYTYRHDDNGITRYLKYTSSCGWFYREEHAGRCAMPAHSRATKWLELLYTPIRPTPHTVIYMGDTYTQINTQ